MKTNPDDRAYPSAGLQNYEESNIVGGMTKLEYFAAMAMQGLLAAVYSNKEILNEFTKEKYSPNKKGTSYLTAADAISSNSVYYAKALIEELNKKAEK